MNEAAAQQERVLALLRRYGTNTCSFLALEAGLSYWFADDDACVAYMDTGAAWVVAGEAIAAPERIATVTAQFCKAAQSANRRACFFAAERTDVPELEYLPVGEQPTWNPKEWPETLARVPSLREQLRRARAKGVIVREVAEEELRAQQATRIAVDALVARWLRNKPLAKMGFVVRIDLYHQPEERRFLIAEREGKLVGILVAVPIYARGGWFFEDVLRDPEAPNGTMELLIDHAMRLCADSGCEHVTYGMAPLAGVDSPWLRRIRDATQWLYDFDGLRAFKAKLRPTRWEPVYIAYPEDEHPVRAVYDSLCAFADGSYLRFGWRTLLHQRKLVTLLLAGLLIPWMFFIAIADVPLWFPSQAIKGAWLGLDLVLLGLLAYLARWWRRELAEALAGLALFDFSLGVLQVWGHNAAYLQSFWEWCLALLSLAAPLFAASFLWQAARDAEAS